MNDLTNIKVGDNIYLIRSDNIVRVETVQKITKTLIRSENYNYSRSNLRITGQGTWSRLFASLETEELKQQWEEQKLKEWITRNWQRISLEDIEILKRKIDK